MRYILLVLFGTTVSFATISQAIKREPPSLLLKPSLQEAPQCEGRPEFITEVRPDIIGGFEKLPQVLLIAREAEYYVEAKEEQKDIRVHSYQSFTQSNPLEKSKIVCATKKGELKDRFSLFAPTLIDSTVDKKVGHSLWQFQILGEKQTFSAWNKKSMAFNGADSLEKTLMKLGASYKIYQLSHDEFELVISKEVSGTTQYLSIKYDAVRSL